MLLFQGIPNNTVLSRTILLCSNIVVTGGFLVFVCVRKIYFRGPIILSLLIWILIMLVVCLYFVFVEVRSAEDDIAVLFYAIIVCDIMLPLSKRLSLSLGMIIIIIHLMLAGTFASDRQYLLHKVRLKCFHCYGWSYNLFFLPYCFLITKSFV